MNMVRNGAQICNLHQAISAPQVRQRGELVSVRSLQKGKPHALATVKFVRNHDALIGGQR